MSTGWSCILSESLHWKWQHDTALLKYLKATTTEKKAIHLLIRNTLKTMIVYSNLYLLLSIPSLLSLLNSLHCSSVFCSSSTYCISGMFCHSYCSLGCRQVVSPIFLYAAKHMKGLIPFKQFYFASFKMTVKFVSWFWQKQNKLVGQLNDSRS